MRQFATLITALFHRYKRGMKILIPLLLLLCMNVSAALPEKLEASILNSTKSEQKVIDLRSQWSVVIFLQTSCPCSNSHLAHLSALVKAYPEVRFLGVHADGYTTSREAALYFQKLSLPFAIIDDANFKWTETFEAMKTPQTFLISPTGEIVYEGAITNSANFKEASEYYLKELLEAVKNKKLIPFEHKRSLGCYITREKKS